ncbi:MAG TPA: YaiO family outer membrane beta-barrel protein [Usitatibacteraceae bacterium]|nr:YaiO family outer membrane beta-barrel protein [Usitatibacteraceae bacterium]
MNRAASCLVALAIAPAAAADFPRNEARLFGAHENLDNGFADWREAGAEFQWQAARDRGAFLRVRETERYGERDREAAAGFSAPVAPGWVLAFEGSGAPSPQVLPEWSALATLSRVFGEGWVASAAARRTRYATSSVSGAIAGLERYAGSFRLAWSLFLSRPEHAAWSSTHRLAATWYGEGLTRAEAGFARGRESEFVPGTGLATSDVRSATLSASLGLAPAWALTLDLERQRQGNRYTRETIRLGTRLLF